MSKIEVLDAQVWWADGLDNWPEVAFLLDREPEFGPYTKTKIPDAPESLYWREDNDFASFFVWAGKPDQGFGGYRRVVQLDDGTEEKVVGGWSGRGEVAASVGHPSTVPVTARTDYWEIDGEKTRKGGKRQHMTHDRFRAEVARHLPNVEVVDERYDILTVKWRGQPSKAEFMKAEHDRIGLLRDQLKGFYGDRHWYDECSDEERALLKTRPYSALGPREVTV